MKAEIEITKEEAEKIIADHFKDKLGDPTCLIHVNMSYIGFGHSERQEAVVNKITIAGELK